MQSTSQPDVSSWTCRSFTHPRRSSDRAVILQDRKRDLGVYGVFDTIGKVPMGPMKRFLNRLVRDLRREFAQPEVINLNELSRSVGELLVRYNQNLRKLNRSERPVFGFCMVVALRYGRLFRLFSLGDCRAYLLGSASGSSGAPPACTARLLSEDHNRLADAVRRLEPAEGSGTEGSMRLLKNELQEMGRELTGYWGWPSDQQVRSRLLAQDECYTIEPGQALLLTTDGLMMPILQSELDRLGNELTPTLFRMEHWLGRALTLAGVDSSQGFKAWYQGLREVQAVSLDYAACSRRVRDDMAILLLN